MIPGDLVSAETAAAALQGVLRASKDQFRWEFTNGDKMLGAFLDCVEIWAKNVEAQLRLICQPTPQWNQAGAAVELLCVGAAIGGKIKPDAKIADMIDAAFSAQWTSECASTAPEMKSLYDKLTRQREKLVGIAQSQMSSMKGGRAGAMLNPGRIGDDQIVLTRTRLQRSPPDILFTTTEILNQRLSDHWMRGLFGVGLDRIRSELRLDALNVKFLEVQLLAVFEDWTALVGLAEFPSLCVARRTPAITAILLEALYQAHIAGPFDAANVAETCAAFEKSVQPFVQSMSIAAAPAGLRKGGWRLLGLEALSDTSRQDLLAILADRAQDLGWIADLLPPQAPLAPHGGEIAAPIDAAREALVQSDAVDSIDLLADAIAAMARLSPDELPCRQFMVVC